VIPLCHSLSQQLANLSLMLLSRESTAEAFYRNANLPPRLEEGNGRAARFVLVLC
jgi:hypothetical protein